MTRGLSWAAIGVYLLSLLGAVVAQHDPSAALVSPVASPPRTLNAPPTPGTKTPWRGFALNLHHTQQLPRYLAAIDELAALGFNSVEVLTPAFQTDGASEQIRIEAGPGRGPTRQQLVTLLQHARRRGLTTTLMPIVLFTQPRGNEWRGKIHPEQWEPWWHSYRQTVDDFLAIATEAQAQVFCIGSELLSTERQTDRWVALIEHARSRFSGQLTYSTNWDHYHVPQFWGYLDMIGINGYWNLTTLTDPKHPAPDQLTQRWREIREQVLAYAATQDRPVLFTEVGYPCLPWGLKDPWNYTNPNNLSAMPHVQAMGYHAFLSAWHDLLRPTTPGQAIHLLRGVYFYEWDPYRAGGPADTGYGVRGKPALDRITNALGLSQPPHGR